MKLFTKISMCVASAALLASTSHAAIINGGFETGNLSSWTVVGNAGASTGVSYGTSGTVLPDSGTYAALVNTDGVAASTIAAAMGLTESVLEASNAGKNATNGSLIYQTVTANAGDSFRFRWNFVEQDYLPYDDWAFYGIKFNSGTTVLTKFASLGAIGPIQGTPSNNTTVNGWTTLNVDITVTGTYTFYFGVVNAEDFSLDSRLWLDDVQAQVLPPVDGPANGVPDGGASIALLGLAMTAAAGFRRKFGV